MQIQAKSRLESADLTTYDFKDGKGKVLAHRHPNGGGWVAETATVEDTVIVDKDAKVFGTTKVSGDTQLY